MAAYSGFEGRASIRSWLYKIATNVCLRALEPRRIRVLPSGLAGPYDGPDRPPSPVVAGEVSRLEPLPDAWSPARRRSGRGGGRTRVAAAGAHRSLQHLPARQRAILILREVLAFSAAETAEILDTTTAAVKSGLQRARARLDELELEPEKLLEPTDRRHARCSTATSRPSSAPMPPCWNRCCAPTRRWRRRHSATGSRAGRCASTCETRTCWAHRATGG